ncbi:MAG TPA: pyrroloquinoline-quinone synthase PqqC [Gammaproteobacteria bacterium]|nr:pyrroloquinoline-quinone synthase PqqC [Gammaproteobacteria bacterium]
MNNTAQNSTVWTSAEFERQLRSLGNRYHIHHPFQVMMNRGELTREQIQGWVCNRFYYQISIPLKDGALISNCPDREVRRHWVQRILDHDGREGHEGGIEAWVRLGEACGLTRDDVESLRHVLPGVRFAVDAYVNFVRRADWREAVSSSLTELFAPTIHKERLANWPKYYPWIDVGGLEYFRKRLKEAHRDVDHGLGLTLQYFTTRAQQEKVIRIVQFKLDVLWTMLDAMYLAYIYEMPPYFNVDESA